MRKALIAGIPLLVLAAGGGAWLALHNRDPIAAAKQRIARSDMRGAELYLRRATAEHPQNAEAAFLLGTVDLALGNPEAAELELRRAQARGYSRAAIILPLGQAYLAQRHFDDAMRDFQPDQAPPDGLADTLTIRAAAQLSMGDTKGAQATIARAQAAAPNARETLLTAARIALAAGDVPAASTLTAKVLAAEARQPEAMLLDSEIALRRNDPATALANAQAVLTAAPNRLDARMLEARALAALNKTDAARLSVQRVLRGTPKNIGANYLETMLAIQVGDYPAADAAMTNLNSVIGQLPRGFYFMAVTKLGMNQPAQAEEAITKFLSANPDDLGGLKLRAFIDLARHHPDKTLDLLQHGKLAAQMDSDTLDLQGRAQVMMGDLKAAEQSFSRAAVLAPKDVQILNRLAAAELGRGETAKAEAELRHSLDVAPNQRLAGEAIVQAALARGDTAEAVRDVEQLRARIGDAEEVGVLAAQVHMAALDMTAAETQLHDVLRRFPDSRAATLNLVRIYGLRGDEAAAQKLLLDLLRRHPADEPALNVLLPSLFASKQVDRAIAVAEAAHEAAPDNIGITAALAGTYVRAHQTARAVGLLDRASAETNPQLDILRAHVLAADGKTDLAETAYRSAIRQSPSDLRAREELGGLLVGAKRYDEARAVLLEGLVLAPGNPSLLGALVGVDLKAGGIQAALGRVAELRTHPQNLPAAYALAGDAWQTTGDERQAAAAYVASYKAQPSTDLAVKAAGALSSTGDDAAAMALLDPWVSAHPDDVEAQSLMSALDLRTNRLDEAETHLKAVLSLRHTDTLALNNLAWIKAQQGDLTGAKSLAEIAYFQTPVAQIADTLGWILARQGDTANALPLLTQASAALRGDQLAATRYHLGYALNAAGRQDDARAPLQLAVDAKEDFPEKAAARKLLAGLK